MFVLRPGLGRHGACRHFLFQRHGQQGPRELAELEQRAKQRRVRHHFAQCCALQSVCAAAPDLFFNHAAPDIQQAAVMHTRRAGGLAGAAGETAIQMQLRFGGGRRAFEHLLDQVDAAARTVEFIAEQLVRRAGGGAEAAVHALAQDAFGLLTFGRFLDEWRESCFHVSDCFYCALHVCVEVTGIQDAGGIESLFQPTMYLSQRR